MDVPWPLLRLFLFSEGVMQVVVNGSSVELPCMCSVTDLLEHLEIGLDRVAVEVNKEIVPRASHASHLLAEGDQVEIVRFVGGG